VVLAWEVRALLDAMIAVKLVPSLRLTTRLTHINMAPNCIVMWEGQREWWYVAQSFGIQRHSQHC
jgi:hypothetical protein